MLTTIRDSDNNLNIRKMFYENESNVMQLGYDVKDVIINTVTDDGQHIIIFDSVAFGRTLVIDGMVQNSVNTEFIYNEMIVHTALDCQKSPKNVLIIGGGSGLTALQVLKYSCVEHITVCDISDSIVKLSNKYFPGYYISAFDNEKVELVISDGFEYIKKSDKLYDAIIVDCCDPIGLAVPLYTKEFYDTCICHLTKNGALCVQDGTPLFNQGKEEYKNLHEILDSRTDIFYKDLVFTCPMIVGGFYMFTIVTKDFEFNWYDSKHIDYKECKYYDPRLRIQYFLIPNFIKKGLVD